MSRYTCSQTLHAACVFGEATKFTHETDRAAAPAKKSEAPIDDPAKRAHRTAKDISGIHKKCIKRAAVAKLLLDDAVQTRKAWARDYHTKRYATSPKTRAFHIHVPRSRGVHGPARL